MRYVARKYGQGSGVYEGSAEELASVDCLLEQVVDIRNAVVRAAYGFGGGSLDDLKTSLPGLLAGFEQLLAKHGGGFLCGSKATLPDFAFYEVMDEARVLSSEVFDSSPAEYFANMPHLLAFLERFESLPRLSDYFKSDKYAARPFNNKIAKFK
jgi:glutathione S-transferase